MDEITAYLPGLSPVENKELCVRFDGGRLSSDGGVLVLREIEKRLGLAARLAGCLSDARDPASTTHSYADMIGARMFAIACGYEDCDDLEVLRFDPAFKLACGRLPESGRDLMSQPTLSRLENAPSWRELARMGLTMIDLFCDSFERVPQRIVLDIDDTPATTPQTCASSPSRAANGRAVNSPSIAAMTMEPVPGVRERSTIRVSPARIPCSAMPPPSTVTKNVAAGRFMK